MLISTSDKGEKKFKDICLDFCIVNDVKLLWKNGIGTGGSCCGHNTTPKEVVLNFESDAIKAKKLLPNFDILYWSLRKLCKQGDVKYKPRK